MSLPILGQEASAIDHTIHIESEKTDRVTKTPATLELLQRRIDEGEAEARKPRQLPSGEWVSNFSVDRTILNDVCLGANQWEHEQLGLGALVMLLAISKDPVELPLLRVVLDRATEKPITLLKVAQLPESTAKQLKLSGNIGKHLWGGIYWVPKAKSINGRVTADFSMHRKDFGAGVTFPVSKDMGSGLEDVHPDHLEFNAWAVKVVVEREYPGFELVPELRTLADQAVPAK
ncbi:MAG TPA: hypothetical protein VJ483_08245 [Holophagaceae bacterium]|nr:hypothetical protein [Holophagaceae bacterium]